MPLEALVETYESYCTAIVDREKARFFLTRMGGIAEETGVLDEVPGQHEQGGWSQGRYHRHIEEHKKGHLKHTADLLLALFKLHRFDHLVLAGPVEVLPEFERSLHDYLKRRIVGRLSLAMAAPASEVLARTLQVEEEMEARREVATLERLSAAAAGGSQAVLGLGPVLEALNEGRVETLVVPLGLAREGERCPSCGRLALAGPGCRTCGGSLEPVPDVVDEALAAALRQGSRLETLAMVDVEGRPDRDMGALLRY